MNRFPFFQLPETVIVPLCEDSMGVAKEQMLQALFEHIKAKADEHNELPRWKFWQRKKLAVEIMALVAAGNELAKWRYQHGRG